VKGIPVPRSALRDATLSREIENLIASYAFLVDDGEFAELGDLLGDAEFSLNGGPVIQGRDAIEKFARDTLLTYDDGTPRTRHVTHQHHHRGRRRRGHRRLPLLLHRLPITARFPLQAIASGRYQDRFQRKNGQWRFTSRIVTTTLTGDTSHHVRNRA
jgi:hypothetical protein